MIGGFSSRIRATAASKSSTSNHSNRPLPYGLSSGSPIGPWSCSTSKWCNWSMSVPSFVTSRSYSLPPWSLRAPRTCWYHRLLRSTSVTARRGWGRMRGNFGFGLSDVGSEKKTGMAGMGQADAKSTSEIRTADSGPTSEIRNPKSEMPSRRSGVVDRVHHLAQAADFLAVEVEHQPREVLKVPVVRFLREGGRADDAP